MASGSAFQLNNVSLCEIKALVPPTKDNPYFTQFYRVNLDVDKELQQEIRETALDQVGVIDITFMPDHQVRAPHAVVALILSPSYTRDDAEEIAETCQRALLHLLYETAQPERKVFFSAH